MWKIDRVEAMIRRVRRETKIEMKTGRVEALRWMTERVEATIRQVRRKKLERERETRKDSLDGRGHDPTTPDVVRVDRGLYEAAKAASVSSRAHSRESVYSRQTP